jgi:flagellar basal-body rod modification protein FlgD
MTSPIAKAAATGFITPAAQAKSYINANTPAASTTGSTSAVASGFGIDKEGFMKLFLTQLANQDPMNPMDQKDMLAQFAQFSLIEAVSNLSSGFANLQLIDAAGMIGAQVTAFGPDGVTKVSGTVDHIEQLSGKVMLLIADGTRIDPSKVVAVYRPDTAAADTAG